MIAVVIVVVVFVSIAAAIKSHDACNNIRCCVNNNTGKTPQGIIQDKGLGTSDRSCVQFWLNIIYFGDKEVSMS